MSLYHSPPPQDYGYPSYPPHGYGHNPPPLHYAGSHGYAQPPPPPPPVPVSYHSVDPSTFRRDYAARLSELTINSRPIIQSLSMIAQDYVQFADIVAQCLEAHIRRVPPWMKLPAFYLLDAISKNVYDPYAAKFSTFVVPLFIETYGMVDSPTRSKMEEMLVTWRNGSPTGREVFGVAAQVALERRLWGNDTASSVEAPVRRNQAPPPITKSQVLAELEVTLAQKDRACQLNPYDTTAQNQVAVLHQLRRLVEHGVSQEELSQILGQLRAMSRETINVPPLPPPQRSNPPMAAQPSPAAYAQPRAPLGPFNGYTEVPRPPSREPAAPTSLPVPSSSTSLPTSSISDLFKSLVKAGLVTSNNTPTGAGTSTKPLEDAKVEDFENAAKAEARQYAQRILSKKIRLTTSDITKQRPQHLSTLYEDLPLRCKQCGIRFAEGRAGKKKMDDHLDMHFRQNRRASLAVGRGHSRSWFISIQDWVHDSGANGKGKGRLDANGRSSNAIEAAEREATLRSSTVVVPPGDEVKNISCPVCKEVLRSEFLDDEEEWVWRNAVLVKDKIFHATCHAEMVSSSTLAAKLRGEASASRGTTPEADLLSTSKLPNTGSPKAKARTSKSPTPDRLLAGTKRKAVDEASSSVERSEDSTPPSKKIALSL